MESNPNNAIAPLIYCDVYNGLQDLPQMKRVEAALSLYNQLQSNRATRELLYQKANTSLKSMLKNNQNFAIEIQESANNAAKQGQFGAFISIILGLCISLALAWLLSRSLAHSIKETQGTLEH